MCADSERRQRSQENNSEHFGVSDSSFSPLACRCTRTTDHARETAAGQWPSARPGDWALMVCRDSGDQRCSKAQNTGKKPPIATYGLRRAGLRVHLCVRAQVGAREKPREGRCEGAGRKTIRMQAWSNPICVLKSPANATKCLKSSPPGADAPAMVASGYERVLFERFGCRLRERGEP